MEDRDFVHRLERFGQTADGARPAAGAPHRSSPSAYGYTHGPQGSVGAERDREGLSWSLSTVIQISPLPRCAGEGDTARRLGDWRLTRLRHDAQIGFWGLPAAGVLF